VPHFGTTLIYLCLRKLKTEAIMWIAVIISVFLSVEVLSYLSAEKTNASKSEGK